MKIKKGFTLACTLAAFNGASANADLLVYFGDGTDADAAALLNLAPAVANTTVPDLDDVGAQTGDPSRITRSSFAGDLPPGPTAESPVASEWLEARSTENQGTASPNDNYFFFTVTADPGFVLNLDTLKYDFVITSNSTSLVGEAKVEAFIAVDGGAFTSFGSITAIDDGLSLTEHGTPVSANLDVSSVTGAQSVEIRLGVGYLQGNSNSISGFAQGIQLEGSVVAGVPETFPLVITPTVGTPGNYDFEWESMEGKVYDLLSSTDLSTSPETWSVYLGNENIAATPPINTLTDVTGSGDPARFFAVVEKDPPLPGFEVAPDGLWTWFTDERSVWHGGYLFVGYIRKDGGVGVSRYDPSTETSSHMTLRANLGQNDHNNPALIVLPSGKLLVVYSGHNTNDFWVRESLVDFPSQDSDWDTEQTINASAPSAYSNTHNLSDETNRIFNFTRSINFNPTLTLSEDLGQTWSSAVHFIATGSGSTRPYPKYCSNGTDRIDLIYTDGHPRNNNNSVYHLYYEGGSFYESDGTLVKSLANLPILHDSGERGTEVYTYDSSVLDPGEGPDDYIRSARAWTWDICYQGNGDPVCAFQVQNDNVTGSGWNHDRIYYYYARWTGTEWTRTFIAHGGRGIYDVEDDYGGGIAIDPDDPNVVYISTNAADPFELSDLTDVPLRTNERYEIFRGVTEDNGATFAWEQLTFDSEQDNLRPIVTKDHGYDRHVIWFTGRYTTFTDYDTSIRAIAEDDPVAE
ncbi:MAG: BNR-4 repeat-containing protein [Verrucomicrobiota bacterium]